MNIRSLFIALFSILIITSSGDCENFTGMWWDMSKPGTGVFIEHLEESNCICGAWYLYDEAGDPFWVTFFGKPVAGKLSTALYSFTGPRFGSAWDISTVKSQVAGTISLDFINSTSVNMTYDIRNESGSLNLVMFSNEVCPGWFWWDPERLGQGVAIFHYLDDQAIDRIGLAWYVYDENGSPIWFTATQNATDNGLGILEFTGPALGNKWDASVVNARNVGSLTLESLQAPTMSTEGELLLPKNRMDYSVKGVSDSLVLEPFMCNCGM